MRGRLMDQAKLLQVFLSPTQTPGPSIYEVSTKPNGDLLCTCAGFKGRTTCKHTRFVQARINSNGGSYPLEISKRATDEDTEKAKHSIEAYRDFILAFGKIEVF
jgi:hypothetical protein